MKKLASTALIALAASSGALANTYTLDFDQASACGANACGNYSELSQSYGDVANLVDLTYADIRNTSATAANYAPMKWWDANYNDLRGVIWSGNGDGNGSSYSRIVIQPLGGQSVTLDSFDIGAYPDATRGTHIRVYEIGGTTALFSYDGNVGLGATGHNTFAPNVSSSKGLWLDWYDTSYNVGVDNVKFTVAAVPEPETYAMLLAGLGILGGVARRRRAR